GPSSPRRAEAVQHRVGAVLDLVAAARLEGEGGGGVLGHHLLERDVVRRLAELVLQPAHSLAQGGERPEGDQRRLAGGAVALERRDTRWQGRPGVVRYRLLDYQGVDWLGTGGAASTYGAAWRPATPVAPAVSPYADLEPGAVNRERPGPMRAVRPLSLH